MSTTLRNRFLFNQQHKSQRQRRLVDRRRLLLEPLETRDLLAAITWDYGASNDLWSNANNWNCDCLPTSVDDVSIPDLASSQVIFDASAGTVSINSLVSDEPFLLSGGELSVTGTVQVDNSFTIDGGTLANATVLPGSGGQGVTIGSSTVPPSRLHGVTLDANLDVSESFTLVKVRDGLTLNGTATLGADSRIAFDSSIGGQTFDGTGAVVFTSSLSVLPGRIDVYGDTQLTIGPDLTIIGNGYGDIGRQVIGETGTNEVINLGTIVVPSNNRAVKFAASTFSNDSDIMASNGGVLILNNPTSSSFTNTSIGTITVTTGGTLIANNSSTNNGLITLDNSTLTLDGTWSNSGGTITTTNSVVQLDGTFTTADIGDFNRSGGSMELFGTLDGTGDTLDLDSTLGTLLMSGGTIQGGTIAGIVSVLEGTSIPGNRLSGATLDVDLNMNHASIVKVSDGLTINGTATLGEAGWLVFDSTGPLSQTLGGTGEVVFTSFNSNGPGQIAVNGDIQLTIGSDLSITGNGFGVIGGQVLFQTGTNGVINEGLIVSQMSGTSIKIPSAAFTNHGVLEARNSGLLNLVNGATNFSAGTLTGGTWNVFADSTLRLNGAVITDNAATILLDGLNSNIESSAGVDGLLNLSTNTAAGDLTISNGRNFTSTGNLTNAGSVTIGAASTLTASTSYTQTAGSTSLESGTLAASGGADIQGGVLIGENNVIGSVTHAGTVMPGMSAGTLSITGDETVADGGTLEIEIGGLTAGTQHDQLLVNGVATFDASSSTLALSLINGFTPSLGDTFQIMTYGSHVGEFTTVNVTSLGGCLAFNPIYNANDLTLEVVLAGGIEITSLSAADVSEGGTATLDGEFTTGNPAVANDVTIDWGDGTPLTMFTLGPGIVTFSTPHFYADDPAGLPDDYTINVMVTSTGCGSDADSTDITVTNLAPTIDAIEVTATLDNIAVVGETVTVSGEFSDLGVEDTHSVTVTWDDGTTSAATVNQLAGTFTANHAYTTGGIFAITVTLNDDDAGAATASTTAWVTGARLTAAGVLQIVGTDGRDSIDVKPGSGGSVIKVNARFDRGVLGVVVHDHFTFNALDVQSIYIVLSDGNDDARVDGDIDVPVFMDGGAGNDDLTGGRGDDTLVGGAGNDDLNGRDGNDILSGGDDDDKLSGGDGMDIVIGGDGMDDLNGTSDGDILIGARVTLDYAMLNDVRNIWTNGASYSARVTALTGVGGLLQPNVKVLDDGVKDTLRGGNGRDVFFADLFGSDKDNVKDKNSNEDLFTLL